MNLHSNGKRGRKERALVILMNKDLYIEKSSVQTNKSE